MLAMCQVPQGATDTDASAPGVPQAQSTGASTPSSAHTVPAGGPSHVHDVEVSPSGQTALPEPDRLRQEEELGQ
ncbi:hypothetical protein PFICI_05816 [Pestalotiopsis fici W106-1]|uniref:Uncharacterized protein n=1 Tax=Pestalotiopsis fici (strain W106-1 / CGMCC3.15140) TaxID=1229662 RepID=W3XD04_PESFW|nr:uncharacterized protein PFICI_05816 [Pestalotiopsis fici W106-1]ETS83940.1 hypothetical protein PFICI_05816 [Pestalotiopsis fici W106-1]